MIQICLLIVQTNSSCASKEAITFQAPVVDESVLRQFETTVAQDGLEGNTDFFSLSRARFNDLCFDVNWLQVARCGALKVVHTRTTKYEFTI